MSETPDRDFEAEAAAMGWRPPDEFRGDPDKFIPAEDYVKTAEERVPVMLATQKNLIKKVQGLESAIEEQGRHHNKLMEQRVEEARAAEREKMREAVAEGDTDAYNAAEKRHDAIVDPAPAPSPAPTDPDLDQFVARNQWYKKDTAMTGAAEAYSVELAQKGIKGADNYAQVEKYIMDEFPHKFSNPNRDDPPSVGRSRAPAKKNGRAFANLPDDAKAAFKKFHKMGVYGRGKSEEDAQKEYLAVYQWED